MEGGVAGVGGVGVPQHGVGAVPGVGYGHLRGVGQIACGAAGDQVVLALAAEVGRGLPHIGRAGVGEVGAVVAGDVGVVVGEVGADGLRMDPLKIVVGLAVRGHRQVEVPGAHAQGAQALPHLGVGTQNVVRRQHGLRLGLVPVHDFQPADKLFRALVVEDVGPVHAGAGVQGGVGVLWLRGDDKSLVLPVVQVGGGVAPHAPVPNAVFAVGFFLVFPIPIIGAVQVHHRAAVGLDALALGVQPGLAGADGAGRCVHERFLLWRPFARQPDFSFYNEKGRPGAALGLISFSARPRGRCPCTAGRPGRSRRSCRTPAGRR